MPAIDLLKYFLFHRNELVTWDRSHSPQALDVFPKSLWIQYWQSLSTKRKKSSRIVQFLEFSIVFRNQAITPCKRDIPLYVAPNLTFGIPMSSNKLSCKLHIFSIHCFCCYSKFGNIEATLRFHNKSITYRGCCHNTTKYIF